MESACICYERKTTVTSLWQMFLFPKEVITENELTYQQDMKNGKKLSFINLLDAFIYFLHLVQYRVMKKE